MLCAWWLALLCQAGVHSFTHPRPHPPPLQQPDAAAGAAPPRRGPGRPPGIPAWNKGVPHSETHRKRISMKLTQKWKDPEFKRSVSESLTVGGTPPTLCTLRADVASLPPQSTRPAAGQRLHGPLPRLPQRAGGCLTAALLLPPSPWRPAVQGKQAWNAGQAHDADTVRKMSEAKLGRRQPLATRKRMSQAAMGRSMGEDARAAVGDRFRGQPKSPEHRSKLAAMARRRHAATRVLRAVEAVYSAASAAPGGGTPAAGSGPVPPAPAPASSGPRSPGGGAGAMAPAGSPPAGSGAAMSGGSAAGAAAGAGRRMGAVRAAAYSMGLTGLSDGSGKRLSRTQILNTFKAELREYRTLQVGGAVAGAALGLGGRGARWPGLLSRPGPAWPAGSAWHALLPALPAHLPRRSAHAPRLPPAAACAVPQEELSTWTAAFREKNNRKPNLVDVQRTGAGLPPAWRARTWSCRGAARWLAGRRPLRPALPAARVLTCRAPGGAAAAVAGIPWLIDKFKQYVVLRDRLFSDTSVLRGKLQEAIPGGNGGQWIPKTSMMEAARPKCSALLGTRISRQRALPPPQHLTPRPSPLLAAPRACLQTPSLCAAATAARPRRGCPLRPAWAP